jgi:hypothetical protein
VNACNHIVQNLLSSLLLSKNLKTLKHTKLQFCLLFCVDVRVIKSRRMRWAGHVARMGEGRGAYRVLVGRPEGKRPLGRPRHRWEGNINMDLREIGIDGANWIRLAQDRVQWRAFVNTVMNLRVP